MGKKTRTVGNGEGTLYYSESLQCWIYQYTYNGKRPSIKQHKNESVRDFKARVTDLKNKLNTGTYIEESKETVITLLRKHMETKYKNGVTSARSYQRDLETLEQIKKTCHNFCNKPIQSVVIDDIENAKPLIKKYSRTTIDKIWSALGKAFKIACSPSRRILIFNVMEDEELKKPISEKKKKALTSLSQKEYSRLLAILDNQERDHKYRNIVKMQLLSGMRIGEVLARSINDIDLGTKQLNVHNTLTQDEHYKIILGEHTKTYNKQTQIDEGQRFLPLDNILFEEILELIKEQQQQKITNIHQLLFWDYSKNRFITPNEVNSWLTRLNTKYNISKERLSTHRLRHTALTHWSELGMPIPVIQYLAGHKKGSRITQQVYIDTSLDFVKSELKKII